jgi:hypothetical protein
MILHTEITTESEGFDPEEPLYEEVNVDEVTDSANGEGAEFAAAVDEYIDASERGAVEKTRALSRLLLASAALDHTIPAESEK